MFWNLSMLAEVNDLATKIAKAQVRKCDCSPAAGWTDFTGRAARDRKCDWRSRRQNRAVLEKYFCEMLAILLELDRR
jgi:hypothetical protein